MRPNGINMEDTFVADLKHESRPERGEEGVNFITKDGNYFGPRHII